MNAKQKQDRIIDLGFEYYELRHRADELLERADQIKAKLWAIASEGKYGRFTIYRVARKRIRVRPHWRSGYRAIRETTRNNGNGNSH